MLTGDSGEEAQGYASFSTYNLAPQASTRPSMLFHMRSSSQPALREELARVMALARGGDGPQCTCYVCATKRCG